MASDFNLHNSHWLKSAKTTAVGELLQDVCALHDLVQHVQQPTRGRNTLDLVMSDTGVRTRYSTHPPIGQSDHSCVIIDFFLRAYQEPKTSRAVWRYGDVDWPRLRHFFKSKNWDALLSGSTDESCAKLTERITQGMERFVPHKLLRCGPSDPAWWTPECTAAHNAKQLAWRCLQQDSSSTPNQTMYNTACRHATSTIAQARQSHQLQLRRKISSGTLRGKQWWPAVKRPGHSRNTEVPVIVDQHGGEHITNKATAECLGQFFSNKCSHGGEDFPNGTFPHVRSRTDKKLLQVHFRIPTVRRALKRLDTSKATGPDGIPATVLNACAKELAIPLSKLFARCFTSGTQPSQWKVARVVPVHKKSSRAVAKN